jgi:hypothetical protein
MYRPPGSARVREAAFDTAPIAQAIRLPRSLHFVPERWSGLNQRSADAINKHLWAQLQTFSYVAMRVVNVKAVENVRELAANRAAIGDVRALFFEDRCKPCLHTRAPRVAPPQQFRLRASWPPI